MQEKYVLSMVSTQDDVCYEKRSWVVRSDAVCGACSSLIQLEPDMLCRCLVNTVVAGCIVMVAKVVPYLSIVMSLVGALLTISISITIPSAASLMLHREEMSPTEKAWALTVILIGIVCAASGTASAVLALTAVLGA